MKGKYGFSEACFQSSHTMTIRNQWFSIASLTAVFSKLHNKLKNITFAALQLYIIFWLRLHNYKAMLSKHNSVPPCGYLYGLPLGPVPFSYIMGQLWYVPKLKTAPVPISVKDRRLLLRPIKTFTALHALLKLWGHFRSPWSTELHYQAPFVSPINEHVATEHLKAVLKLKGFASTKARLKTATLHLLQWGVMGLE